MIDKDYRDRIIVELEEIRDVVERFIEINVIEEHDKEIEDDSKGELEDRIDEIDGLITEISSSDSECEEIEKDLIGLREILNDILNSENPHEYKNYLENRITSIEKFLNK